MRPALAAAEARSWRRKKPASIIPDNASESAAAIVVGARRAMASLPEEQRLAVALVLVEGLSYKEAAEALDVPIGTLTSRLARGREALQKQLRMKVDHAVLG